MIVVPADRTSKQPVLAKCCHPGCAENGKPHLFVVAGDTVRCDKCGSNDPAKVRVQVLIHLLVPSPEGPITGMHGRKWKLACDEDRAYLATVTNLEAATGMPEAANCPGCLAAYAAAGPQLIT